MVVASLRAGHDGGVLASATAVADWRAARRVRGDGGGLAERSMPRTDGRAGGAAAVVCGRDAAAAKGWRVRRRESAMAAAELRARRLTVGVVLGTDRVN